MEGERISWCPIRKGKPTQLLPNHSPTCENNFLQGQALFLGGQALQERAQGQSIMQVAFPPALTASSF